MELFKKSLKKEFEIKPSDDKFRVIEIKEFNSSLDPYWKEILQKYPIILNKNSEYLKYEKEKWIDSIVSFAKYRGIQVKTDYTEAFHIMKFLLNDTK